MKNTINLSLNSADQLIEKFMTDCKDFEVSSTGYSTIIKLGNVNYFCHDAINSGGRKNILTYRSKIMADIKKKEINFDFVPSSKVRYYELGKITEKIPSVVYNFDISAAYPSALHKLGFISDEVMSGLMKLKKVDRLKAIGSIATRKTITKFIKGVPQDAEIKENKIGRDIFFLLCYEIGELMFEIRTKINSFLFFWFDGIYFTDINEKDIINKIITEKGYLCKFEQLTEFTKIIDEENDRIKINYLKENKKKSFNLPINYKINKF